MPSALITSALGALQASFSVLLTLGYGVLAAYLGMLDSLTTKNISKLCLNMFLPALLITDVGSQLTHQNFTTYIPVFIWAVTYSGCSIIFGKLAVWLFGMPSWVTIAVAFNNTTSLPLLLTKSLAATGILKSISGESAQEAVQRAQGFFLINSMVSNALTFSLGPRLIDDSSKEIKEDDDDIVVEENPPLNPNERTSLLPQPISARIVEIEQMGEDRFNQLPDKVQSSAKFIFSFLNPTLYGALLAIFIGVIPPIHRAFFAQTDDGGFLNGWLTSSLRNIGDLFTALQMFVVGSQLLESFQTPSGKPPPNPPKRAFIFIFVVRFLIWGCLSIFVVYILVTKTSLLHNDPILWFSLMLMPVGPPAMVLSTLAEVAGVDHDGKMMIARMLTYMYIITPIMFIAVVGALRACERLLEG